MSANLQKIDLPDLSSRYAAEAPAILPRTPGTMTPLLNPSSDDPFFVVPSATMAPTGQIFVRSSRVR